MSSIILGAVITTILIGFMAMFVILQTYDGIKELMNKKKK